MIRLPLFQVDAFASRPFEGNPAAVVPWPGPEWPSDELLQRIASENALSETAFVRPPGLDGIMPLRWFTPGAEVDLCGHATLATGHVVLSGRAGWDAPETARFSTRSGVVTVARADAGYVLTLPARPPREGVTVPGGLLEALGCALAPGVEVLASPRDAVVVLPTEQAVRALNPDMADLAAVPVFGVAVTALGDHHDYVARYFAPGVGVPEDPVTGSAHAVLAPLWHRRLGRTRLRAAQIGPRGGELVAEVVDDTVLLYGRCADYLVGTLTFEESS